MLAGLLTNSYEEDIVADFHESKAFTEKEFPPTMSDEDIMDIRVELGYVPNALE